MNSPTDFIQSPYFINIILLPSLFVIAVVFVCWWYEKKLKELNSNYLYLKNKDEKYRIEFPKSQEKWQAEIRKQTDLFQEERKKNYAHVKTIQQFTDDRDMWMNATTVAQKAAKMRGDELLELQDANERIQKTNQSLLNKTNEQQKAIKELASVVVNITKLKLAHQSHIKDLQAENAALYEIITSLAQDLPEKEAVKAEMEFYDTISEIKEGDKFLCTESYRCGDTDWHYKRGTIYISPWNEFLTEEGNTPINWASTTWGDKINAHFKKIKP